MSQPSILPRLWQFISGIAVLIGIATGGYALYEIFTKRDIAIFKGSATTDLNGVLTGENRAWGDFLSTHSNQTVYVDFGIYVTMEGTDAQTLCTFDKPLVKQHAEDTDFIVWTVNSAESVPPQTSSYEEACAHYAARSFSPIELLPFEFDLSTPVPDAAISGPHHNSASAISWTITLSGFFNIAYSDDGGQGHYILTPAVVTPQTAQDVRAKAKNM